MYRTIRTGSSRTSTIIAAVGASPDRLPRTLTRLDKSVDGALSTALVRPGFDGKLGEIAFGDESAVLLGLGDIDTLDAQALRDLGGKLVKALHRANVKAVQIEVAASISSEGAQCRCRWSSARGGPSAGQLEDGGLSRHRG